MKKQPAVTAATRQKLTDAFWELLEKKELSRITVKEITDLADYNRGTFYQYFTDIYALVEDEEERILSAIREINAPKILQESPESLPGAIVPFIEQNKRKIALLLAKRGDVFLGKIKEAFDKAPDLANILLDPYFQEKLSDAQQGWRKVVSQAIMNGVPAPCMSAALEYYDGYRTERLPANLLQAQRDYFGAHTYERTDRPRGEFFHTNWTGHGGDTVSTTYNA